MFILNIRNTVEINNCMSINKCSELAGKGSAENPDYHVHCGSGFVQLYSCFTGVECVQG